MSRAAARLTHVAWLLVAATGLAYAWMCYLASPEDEFALTNHPWQPAMQAAHILAAPLFVYVVGLLWRGHVWPRLRQRDTPRRRTGLALLTSALVAILSGYVLQVATGDALRSAMVWTHGISGALLVIAYLVHQVTPPRRAHADPTHTEPTRGE